MKKLAIAGASVALAAMPVVGVFATAGVGTIVDLQTITVDSSCTVTSNGTVGTGAEPTNWATTEYHKTVTFDNAVNGQTKTATGSEMNIKCNDGSGWELNALGSVGTGDLASTAIMTGTAGTSAPIQSGTATSGDNSSWALKITAGTGNAVSDTLVSSEVGFVAVPGSTTKVAHSAQASDMGTGDTVTASYQVYVGELQQADTYSGSVTYTLVHPYTPAG